MGSVFSCILKLGTKCTEVVSITLWPLCTRDGSLTWIKQMSEWVTEAVWAMWKAKNFLGPTGSLRTPRTWSSKSSHYVDWAIPVSSFDV